MTNTVIVGGGIAGAALAHALACRGEGEGVLLLEREPTAGQHSTGKNAAILRTAIDARLTRRLALETARFIRDPGEGFADHPLLDEVGFLLREGRRDDAPPLWLEDHLAAGEVVSLEAESAGVSAPFLGSGEGAGERAWWFPRAGRIDVAGLLDGYLRGARRRGVQVRTRAGVRALLGTTEAVSGVELDDGSCIEAEQVVVAAGGWAGRLGGSAAAAQALLPTRRHLVITGEERAVDPRWPIVWDDRAGFYARPESGGWLACGCDQEEVDPDSCTVDAAAEEEALRKLARHLPGYGEAPLVRAWSGLRTVTPDDVPVIGPDPERGGLFWLAGLGGHGISVSAGVGRLAADILSGVRGEESSAVDPGRFAPTR